MTEHRKRSYTAEFKLQALELAETSGKSLSQIERELDIAQGMLCKWRARYKPVLKKDQPNKLEPHDLDAAQAEIRRLQRELAIEREEKDILKKVVNIFSRKSP